MKKDILAKQQRAALHLAAGEKFFEGYRYREAIAEWKRAAALARDTSETAALITKAESILSWIDKLRERAADFRHKGERLRAAMMCAEILKLDPALSDIQLESAALDKELTEINAHIEAGEALFQRHEYGGAIAEWKEVLTLDKHNAEAVFLIEKAKDILARAEGLLEKAREYRRQGRLDPAARTYEELLRLFPNLSHAGKELAEVNAEIRRANASRPGPERKIGPAPEEKEIYKTDATSSAKELNSGGTPPAWKAYCLIALLFMTLASLFKVLPLAFLSPSPSPLFAISATMSLVLFSLLLFSLSVFSV